MSQSRQLAAIMFTDVVGYTSLMEEDEQKAFELLNKNRQLQKPVIEKHNGRWLKEIGDGVLASFSTVSEAVYCAKEIQEKCRNQPDLQLRIGIHQGEVVFDGNDVFGSGVNIASRLVPLAPIGGILVSESVYKNILNKKGIESVFVGEKELKGVKGHVQIYNVEVEGAQLSELDITTTPSEGTSTKSLISKRQLGFVAVLVLAVILSFLLYQNIDRAQFNLNEGSRISDRSIAVIPFKNLSSEVDSEYFSDGMMDAILSRLSKIGDLRLISRTSMEQYRESQKSIPEIAQELGVSYILEGSVQRYSNNVSIIVQLIDAKEDTHLWSEIYTRELNEVFLVQSEIAMNIASALQTELSPEEIRIIELKPTNSLAAYEFYLKGSQYHNTYMQRRTTQDLQLAKLFYNRAIELDPNFIAANVGLGWTFIQRVIHLGEESHLYDSALLLTNHLMIDYSNRSELLSFIGSLYRYMGIKKELAKKYLKNAITLNPNDETAMELLAWYLGLEETRYDLAMYLNQKATEIAPNKASLYNQSGYFWDNLNDHQKGEESYLRSIDLQPDYSLAYGNLGIFYVNWKADYEKAIFLLNKALTINKDDLLTQHTLGMLYSFNGEFEKSEDYYLKVKTVVEQPNFTRTVRTPWFPEYYGYTLWKLGRKEEAGKYFQQGIEVANKILSDSVQTFGFYPCFNLAGIFAFLGDSEQAFYWLNKILHDQSWGPPRVISINPLFNQLKNDSRLRTYIDKYNARIQSQEKNFESIKNLPLSEVVKILDKPLQY